MVSVLVFCCALCEWCYDNEDNFLTHMEFQHKVNGKLAHRYLSKGGKKQSEEILLQRR